MTLKQLEVFVAVAETGSFSRGGEKTCITQSTASQHIQGLEDELGTRLFDRGRGGALLTEAGKLFLGKALKILAECDESRSAMRRFLGMEDIILKVGASNTPASSLIPAMLGRFQAECPRVRLEVSQGDSRSVAQLLVSEEIEVAVIGGRYEDDRVHFEPIGEDTIVCAVSSRKGSGDGTSLSQAELCKVPLIVRETGSGTQQAVYDALAGTWISFDSLKIIAVLGSGEAVKRALLEGAGYAFVSSKSIARELAEGQLVTVRIPGVTISRKFYAAYRSGRELSPAAAAFLAMILESRGLYL
jgi:DNA-binding transcriptional LysR family regulator